MLIMLKNDWSIFYAAIFPCQVLYCVLFKLTLDCFISNCGYVLLFYSAQQLWLYYFLVKSKFPTPVGENESTQRKRTSYDFWQSVGLLFLLVPEATRHLRWSMQCSECAIR